MAVNGKRIQILNSGGEVPGPVVYWMNRDQRVDDNWALLFAQEEAIARKVPLLVVFVLVSDYLGANLRHYDFMARGFREVENKLMNYRIPLFLLRGSPGHEIPSFIKKNRCGIIVTDFSPLRINRYWRSTVAENVKIPFYEVDTHNIVPCRVVSEKAEYGAYTFRPKIQKVLPEYLVEFPSVVKHPFAWKERTQHIDWDIELRSLKLDSSVGVITRIVPGEKAVFKVLSNFLDHRLKDYDERRNDPLASASSGLSPYLHFGQISAQRVALEIQRFERFIKSSDSFLEELIVRKELAENFCYYNNNYDSPDCFPAWSKETLNRHRRDRREYIYRPDAFEYGETHDPLWNAAQNQMVNTGTMHGYLRMYWAKKILEWTKNVEDAMETAIYLNDKYELDGRDPNGYAGIAWSIGGVHDRAWGDRNVFGKIRYMNYEGCKRKFDVKTYIEKYGMKK
jgi:deoxyribodipyrimidine photo-lyase